MKLSYKYNNQIYTTESSNDIVTITDCHKLDRNITEIKANADIELISASITIPNKFSKNDIFFLNGYQSWTDTREYSYNEKLKNPKKIPEVLNNKFAFTQYGDSAFYEMKKNVFHAFDVSYVKGLNPLFIGSYNYKNAYLIIEYHKKNDCIVLNSDIEGAILKIGESFTLFDYVVDKNVDDKMKEYFNTFRPKSNKKLFGYTSWYNHYQDINEEKILTALAKADKRFNLFQIDDGFETFVGDWLNIDKNKFPNGLKSLVDKIHDRGMKAGIWLAPFVCETKSDIYNNKYEWIKKDKDGNPVSCGGNWSGFYPLDLNNPEVIDYIKEVLRYYKDLGFDFFKLDFLYGALLSGINGKTRASATEEAYQILADELSDKIVLGCGAIPSNCYSKFDFLRIGPDVSLKFDDIWYMKYMHRERISTKVTLQNTIFRSPMNHHVFLNDPDVFLLRDDNISLSWEQRVALTKINALFGSLLMTSDNPSDYDEKKNKILNEAIDLFKIGYVEKYSKRGKYIDISYKAYGKTYNITYDTMKGVIVNG